MVGGSKANFGALRNEQHYQKKGERKLEDKLMREDGEEIRQRARGSPEREGKYLSFFLASEEYGIEILKVKEIIGMMRITPIPQTPEYVKGVINLRGKVIPVIDLRLQFGMNETDYTDRTCIIVVEIGTTTRRLPTGIVVDCVSEVLNIKGSEIEDAPIFGTTLNTDFILGMAKTGSGVKVLLNIDRALTTDEHLLLDQVA